MRSVSVSHTRCYLFTVQRVKEPRALQIHIHILIKTLLKVMWSNGINCSGNSVFGGKKDKENLNSLNEYIQYALT